MGPIWHPIFELYSYTYIIFILFCSLMALCLPIVPNKTLNLIYIAQQALHQCLDGCLGVCCSTPILPCWWFASSSVACWTKNMKQALNILAWMYFQLPHPLEKDTEVIQTKWPWITPIEATLLSPQKCYCEDASICLYKLWYSHTILQDRTRSPVHHDEPHRHLPLVE